MRVGMLTRAVARCKVLYYLSKQYYALIRQGKNLGAVKLIDIDYAYRNRSRRVGSDVAFFIGDRYFCVYKYDRRTSIRSTIYVI